MDEKFNAILSVALVPQVVDLIAKNSSLNDADALNAFYKSKTYELLSKENTKIWHFSPLTVYSIWEEERKTGKLILPEE